MKTQITILALVALVAVSSAMGQPAPGTAKKDKDIDLEVLAVWLEGSFSSKEQAATDSTYLDIRLRMKRIWHTRTDGYWFVVEQAVATSQDAPYRQRVYQVRRVEERMIESRTFTWKDPARVIGAWKDTTLVDGLDPSHLALRRGCEVYMQLDAIHFFGSTHGTACTSELRGASYATSEVKIYRDKIVSWDRGYSSDNAQVWGATKGGYVFLRQEGW